MYSVYTVNIHMRLCVTLPSDSPVIDSIFTYCQLHDIAMFPAHYIAVDSGFYAWRIESEPCVALTWLLARWSNHLIEF
jgi:hypothetical protein